MIVEIIFKRLIDLLTTSQNWFLLLVDTYLLIKLLMVGHLDKKFSGGGGGWWHCNYSFKLQGSRGDLESLPLVELDSRPRESNSWTPSLTIGHHPTTKLFYRDAFKKKSWINSKSMLSSSGSRSNSLKVYCQVQLKVNSLGLPWSPGAWSSTH